ncbi:MAG TPA: hypothetical protein VIZ30_03715 [Pseudomonadales bacterium]
MRVYRAAITWPEREAIHDAIAAYKHAAIAKRVELGKRYLDANRGAGAIDVPRERAVATLDLVEQTRTVRDEAIATAKGRASQHDSGSLQYPALAHDFAVDSAAIRFATSPLILAPIIRYCGMLPVLFNFFVTRAYQDAIKEQSAHHFHLDPEDTISFKVFVQLTDVDDDCGPFHALPASLTRKVLHEVGYSGITFLTDERIEALVGWDSVVKLTGPAGTVGFVDTTRCLHFGGRPRKAGKPVRDQLVFQYLLPTSVLFPIDGDAKHPRFLPQLQATGDACWDALIGATDT